MTIKLVALVLLCLMAELAGEPAKSLVFFSHPPGTMPTASSNVRVRGQPTPSSPW
jgi:hypothetical protein